MVARRFDVFHNPSVATARKLPYLLAVQSDLLGEMDTCSVVPLMRLQAARSVPSERLNPRFEIDGVAVVMLTQLIGPVPMKVLRKHATNLEAQRGSIVAALDFLFEGI